MCMYTIDPTLRKDHTDTTVYKIILRDISDKSSIEYITPFTFTIIEMPYLKAEGKLKIGRYKDYFKNTLFSIDQGMIHSYLDFKKVFCALEILQTKWKSNKTIRVELWECIIPANVEYITGSNLEVCSKSIKFIKDITDKINKNETI